MAKQLGSFYCECCCSSMCDYDDQGCNRGYMRCESCGCRVPRRGEHVEVVLRVSLHGVPSIATLEKATQLVRLLGGDDAVTFTRENDALFYFEIPGGNTTSVLEVADMRRRSRSS